MDTVLVIDDERLTRQVCSDILASAGFRVLAAADAQEGLRLAREESIGVILLDVMMPRMSGIDALKRLGEVAPNVPVIMITAYATQSRIIDSLRYGAYDFLPKPFEPSDLLHSVKRAMDRHQLLQENRKLVEELNEKVRELTTLKELAESLARHLEDKVKEQTFELSKSKQLLENILASMASGLLVVNLDGNIAMLNRHGAEVLHCSQERLLGKKFLDLFPDTHELLTVRPDQLSRELELRLPDGVSIPLGFTNSYLLDPQGEREGVIILFRDLSEIRRLREEIRRKDRLAAIGEMVAGVAHEIRNPLFGISSVAQILSREVDFDQAHRDLVSAMLSEIKRLNALVEDLLFYGRPLELKLHPEDLNQIWEEILSLSKDQLVEGGVILQKELDPELPLILLDGHKIRQVFLNLLKNAMEATPPGGVITVRTRLQRLGTGNRGLKKSSEFVEVSLQDTGFGIAPENLGKLFNPFFTTKASGSGLGLPICLKIVEDHGGTIRVQSERGKGSCFTVLLPLRLHAE